MAFPGVMISGTVASWRSRPRGRGGTGRHTGLKILRGRPRAGSTPAVRTSQKENVVNDLKGTVQGRSPFSVLSFSNLISHGLAKGGKGGPVWRGGSPLGRRLYPRRGPREREHDPGSRSVRWHSLLQGPPSACKSGDGTRKCSRNAGKMKRKPGKGPRGAFLYGAVSQPQILRLFALFSGG